MYSYEWDEETGGYLLNSTPLRMSKEPRPVYYKELDILGFDRYWDYEKDDSFPYMWAEANKYIYRGRTVAEISGGTLYDDPEIKIIEEPEYGNAPLRFVNLKLMVKKNESLLNALVQETIKKIYNTYVKYKDQTDVFYVAFSGGKDSVVVLDLVKKALPHNDFKVLFSNTDMEFPTTYDLVKKIKDVCSSEKIDFQIAKADFRAEDSWRKFGPPARRVRWCCSVHKTVPVINKLAEMLGNTQLRTVMITGVRSYESPARSDYDELSFGKKMAGQYSYHPILDWDAAEVYLYIYSNKLLLNDAYKYGFNRVGCIMCPNSTEKHEYIKRRVFEKEVKKFSDIIVETSKKDLSGDNKVVFLNKGIWKNRLSGRELLMAEEERFQFDEKKDYYEFQVRGLNDNWKIWYKTIGKLLEDEKGYTLEYNGIVRRCTIENSTDGNVIKIENLGRTKNSIEFLYYFRSILAKTLYCIECKTCVAECPYRNIAMEGGKLSISDSCIKCHACLKIQNGCLYYNSIIGSKSVMNLKGVNKYLSLGVDAEWIKNYFKDSSYEPGNRKTDVMYGFLGDAGVLSKRKYTEFGEKIKTMNISDDVPWALMLCNLVYTPSFNWYILNIPLDETYIEDRLELDMADTTAKARGEFWNGFKTILGTNEAFKDIGLGIPDITEKTNKNGDVRKSMNSIRRTSWTNPNQEVILYSLYKFAEECRDYYQFTLSRLLDYSVDSDGISPTLIFGLDRDEMVKILTGLSINHPDFINATFTLDLDNISLNSEKTSNDVLNLF